MDAVQRSRPRPRPGPTLPGADGDSMRRFELAVALLSIVWAVLLQLMR